MSVEIKKDQLEKIVKNLRKLADHELYVGIPATSIRDDGTSNAFLAYIHEYGSPAANIPARPFLQPAIDRMKDRAIQRMKAAGIFALDGKLPDMLAQFESLGMEIAEEARLVIAEGIPPPLKPSTLAERARKHGGVVGRMTPLWDTGQMKNAITFMVTIK